MVGISDTSPEAERVLREVYRRMPLARKWLLLGEMYQDGCALHAAGVRLRHPSATAHEIRQHWMAVTCGLPPAASSVVRNPERPMQNLSGLREVLAVLTRLAIPYALGGSMASSVYGVPRNTRDADVTAEPFPGKETPLVAAFGEDCYISEPAVRDAVPPALLLQHHQHRHRLQGGRVHSQGPPVRAIRHEPARRGGFAGRSRTADRPAHAGRRDPVQARVVSPGQ